MADRSEVDQRHRNRQTADEQPGSPGLRVAARRYGEEQPVYGQNDELILFRAKEKQHGHDRHRRAATVQRVDERRGEKRHEGHLVKVSDAVCPQDWIDRRNGDQREGDRGTEPGSR